MAESMYQNLSTFLPPTTDDVRSVHFLQLPQVKEEYFDADIERSVG